MRESKLFQTLKTLPKGVLHNVFFDCCEDLEFVHIFLWFSIKITLPMTPMFMSLKTLFHFGSGLRNRLKGMDGFLWQKRGLCTRMMMILLRP